MRKDHLNILHLAFLSGHTRNLQFFRKVNAQHRAMKKLNPGTQCVVIGENVNNLDLSRFEFQYIDLKSLIFPTPVSGRLIRYRIVAQLIRRLRPHLVYCRYPFADIHLYNLVREFPCFIFEHQTKETHELEFNLQKRILKRELAYGAKVLANVAGIVAVSPDYLAYELERTGSGGTQTKPGYTMCNGVDLERMVTRRKQPAGPEFNILCLASFSPWHGYDRLIRGIHLYRGNEIMHVHMVGTGPELERYRNLVNEYALENVFTFHGRLEPDAYQEIVDRCHIAMGALGLHRMNLHVTASLKNREYCGMGIPFVYSGRDSDFETAADATALAFVKAVPDNDDAIDIKKLLEFARQCSRIEHINTNMRQYAETHLSWEVKIKGLLSFFKSQPIGSDNLKGKEEITGQLNLESLLTLVQTDPWFKRSPLLCRRLIAAELHRQQGNSRAALEIYMGILDHMEAPKKFLFRIMVEMEQLDVVNDDRLRHYAKKILSLYEGKKRLDRVEMYRMASLYKMWGQLDQAKTWFEKIMKKNPQEMSGGIFFHLAEICLKKGDIKEARHMFKLCLKEIPNHQKAQAYLDDLK